MGNYNSQYESYYNSIANRGRDRNYLNSSSNLSFPFFSKARIMRRAIQELAGGVVLFSFIIVCKSNIIPQSKTAYNFSKDIIKQDYDYTYILKEIQSLQGLNIDIVQNDITDWIEQLKVKVMGGQTVKQKIETSYLVPVSGKILSPYGKRKNAATGANEMHEGVDIQAKENTDVLCSYDGNVTEVAEDPSLGKYILVDHGDGIETKYGNLNEQLVKVGDKVKKGQVIAKSGKTGKVSEPLLYFSLIYMDKAVDPQQYLSFVK